MQFYLNFTFLLVGDKNYIIFYIKHFVFHFEHYKITIIQIYNHYMLKNEKLKNIFIKF